MSHIKNIDKARNPEQKEKKVISLLVKLGGEKMGFGPLVWFGLDWNWYSSGPVGVLSNFDPHNMSVK